MQTTTPARRFAVYPLMGAVLLAACILSLMVGRQPLSPADVLHSLVAGGSGETVDIVRGLRLERTVVALVVGLALGGVAASGVLLYFNRFGIAVDSHHEAGAASRRYDVILTGGGRF